MHQLSQTESLCPECLNRIPARIFERDGKVWIEKECSEHGRIEDLYWGSYDMYERAQRFMHEGRKIENPTITKLNPICPNACGLCTIHVNHSALANMVVTNRCDRNCWYCFFFAEKSGYVYEPTLDQIREMFRSIRREKPVPCNAVQLTGGEPTLRDDLVEIIKIGKEEGVDHVQLNTDGIRLATDSELAPRVREAGVNTVYLSFDGTTPDTNPKNHWQISKAFENCRGAGLGIVLVPTIINTINDGEVGNIMKFASENIDVVRGVNFQPVSLVGRISNAEREKLRITIPDVILKMEQQTNGEITRNDFYPVPTITPLSHFVEALTGKPEYEFGNHFACGMATYVFKDRGKLIPITRFVDIEGLLAYLEKKADELKSGKSKYLVGADLLFKLGKFIDKSKQPEGLSLPNILYKAFLKHDYDSLGDFHHKALFIGLMHFQDLYNYDIERVKRCNIHYTSPDGRIIPFCAFNVIPEWYRDKIQKEYGVPIPEWEKKTGRKITDDLYRGDSHARVEAKKRTIEPVAPSAIT
jgi:uncharacterized radical SAM superfamily Fe-S cluster-containing enzyme